MTEPLNILLAWPYASRQILGTLEASPVPIRLLIDSGAFTAWKNGDVLRVDDYIAFIRDIGPMAWRYFALDVVGDTNQTLANYKTMVDAGLDPIPVFTRGMPISVMQNEYADASLVGVGGLVGTRGNAGFVAGISTAAKSKKLHWLGFAREPYLRKFRPFSVDSSSWESGARYGQILDKDFAGQRLTIKRSMMRRPSLALVSELERRGYRVEELCQESWWSGGFSGVRRACARNAVRDQYRLKKQTGVQVFTAAAAQIGIKLLIEEAACIES